MEGAVSEFLPDLQFKTNEFIKEGHDIKTEFEEGSDSRRVWICDKWRMNCGGTHLKNTSEIGAIKLKRKNLGAGKERIEISLA